MTDLEMVTQSRTYASGADRTTMTTHGGEYDYYSLPRRDRSKGIAGLYGYYVYLLKIYPKMDLSLSREVYVSLREESRKAKIYSDEAVLLDDNKIKTADDMRRFTQSVSDQFRELAIKRSKLRNKLRRMTDSEAMQPIKDEMYALTDEMKELRRKMKLCEDIARRSGAVEAVVNTIDSYEITADKKKITKDYLTRDK